MKASKIAVSDPFNAVADAALPGLALALDPSSAREEFKRRLPRLSRRGKLHLKAIRVSSHKPGRRCVVEYDVRVLDPDARSRKLTLVGKIRARRSGNEGYRLLDAIWRAGFQSKSADGISVPKPVGVISRFQMWFQRKVPGRTATLLLPEAQGAGLAIRIAEAIYKLHRANVPTDRVHGMVDELRILNDCLGKVRQLQPGWSARLSRIARACEQLGASLPEPRPCGIHRDFYPAQVLVHDDRIYLIDFDLYCLGDPALDIGNFVGHMQEQALRELGDARAMDGASRALVSRFTELSRGTSEKAIEVYTDLTLARHIYLSTQYAERRAFTEALLTLCESRLSLV
jgi:hypothetical protein